MPNIANTSFDRKAVKGAMQEISASLTRIEGEKDFIKEAISDVAKKNGVSKKIVAKLAKVFHKQSFTKEVEANDEFESMYETLFNKKDTASS